MDGLAIALFGKMQVGRAGRPLLASSPSKVRELLAYLMLYRDRPHPREALASLLWADSAASQGRKYLRQTLWQLQTGLEPPPETASQLLVLDRDWVQIDPQADYSLDVAVLEEAHGLASTTPGRQLTASTATFLERAVEVYQGDLLEGCYQDWCVYERERLQGLYLGMLDKLVAYHEARRDYPAGLEYANRILKYERARESTHRRLMRLYYLSGDRSAALRQYERCVAALQEELGVGPAKATISLHERLRADRPLHSPRNPTFTSEAPSPQEMPLPEILSLLKNLYGALTEVERQIRVSIGVVEQKLEDQR
jgi:DNA-binding SARP family transcriptional activator